MFTTNKYSNWYYSIIAIAKSRVKIEGYMEKHHIIPKSLGGNNSATNIVSLTAKEHFICHLLLPKMVTTQEAKMKMWYAAYGMTRMSKNHQRYRCTSRTYEILKENMGKANSLRPGPNKGKKLSDEWRAKLSIAFRGRKLAPRTAEHSKKLAFPKSEETKRKLSEARLGKSWGYHHSNETKQKMSDWQRGIPKPIVTCIHCGKEASLLNITRWHNDNCKKQVS